jgi:hypothetical protein
MRCPICRLENPPGSEKCDCGYNFITKKEGVPSLQPGVQDRDTRFASRVFGIVLIILGLSIAGFFTLVFDTSVPVPKAIKDTEVSSESTIQMPDRMNNIGLLQDRQSGISGGLELSILGGLLLLYGKENG